MADIVLVIAMKEELDVLLEDVQVTKVTKRERVAEHAFQIQGADHALSCIAISGDVQTEGEARAITDSAVKTHKPKLAILIGISGGISSDVRLGDVVVADSVDMFLFRGKFEDPTQDIPTNRKGRKRANRGTRGRPAATADDMLKGLKFAGEVHKPEPDIVGAARIFPQIHQSVYADWQQMCTWGQKRSGASGTKSVAVSPNAHIGPIASGPFVVASQNMKEKLQARNRRMQAVDMESAGFLAAIEAMDRHTRPSTLVVRGISDHADPDKAKLEKASAGRVRSWSMRNAVTYVKRLLPKLPLFESIEKSASSDADVALLQTRVQQISLNECLLVPSAEEQERLESVDAVLKHVLPVEPESISPSIALLDQVRRLDAQQYLLVVGGPGTGKSTALSALYLRLRYQPAGNSTRMVPALVNLHKYARPDHGTARDDSKVIVLERLKSDLALLDRLRQDRPEDSVVFLVDGFDRDMPMCRDLGELVLSRVQPTDRLVVSSRDLETTIRGGRNDAIRYLLQPISTHTSSMSDVISKVARQVLKQDPSPRLLERLTDMFSRGHGVLDLWSVANGVTELCNSNCQSLCGSLLEYSSKRLSVASSKHDRHAIGESIYNEHCNNTGTLPISYDPRVFVERCFLYSHSLLRDSLDPVPKPRIRWLAVRE